MTQHERFHLRDLSELRQKTAALNLDVPTTDDLSILGTPFPVAGRPVPNRFVVQPMEGYDSVLDGAPGPLSFRRYERYARGGAGLIWFEATAVLHEARSNARQLYLHQGNVDSYRRLVDHTRRTARDAGNPDPVLVLQLTHSGRYSKPQGVPEPILAHHSKVLDPVMKLPADYPLITDDGLDRLRDVFVSAAGLAAEAGFDGVDIKSCHRYLISELLASHTRSGKYGGSLENRTRFLREVLTGVRQEVTGIFATLRLNVFDAIAYPYGWGVDAEDPATPDLTEPLALINQLAAMDLPLLNVTIGNPYFNPHYGRPYDFPVKGAEVPNEHPLRAIARFIEITAQVQQAVPALPVVGSGYAWLRHLMPHVAAAVIERGNATFIGQGRGSFAYPDAVREIMNDGRMDPSQCCITCSACTQIMRDGGSTGCVVRDHAIYGPLYRKARRMAADRLRSEALRCRDCETATCSAACPAGVDVPAFLKAYAADDIPAAYDILRDVNALPEMCARVCPSEVQCEGGCLENIFCEHPIPIRDIQYDVCRRARRMKITGVKLPESPALRGRIAIAGGGPGGIACAISLLERGYEVTIFERDRRLGGVPDAIIPSDRFGEAFEETEAILEPARRAGRLTVRDGSVLGENLDLADLQKTFAAVFLAVGLDAGAGLEPAPRVYDALQYLRAHKAGNPPPTGTRCAVLGGGNTAMDAALAAMENGVRDLYLVYRRSYRDMPAWQRERERLLEAGAHLLMLSQPLGYAVDREGQLTGVRIARTILEEPDDSGRRRPRLIENSESLLAVDSVIEALGQTVPDNLRQALQRLEFTAAGLPAVDPVSMACSEPGVFAGGDLVNGGATVVQAVSDGYRAARAIDDFLRRRHGNRGAQAVANPALKTP